MGGVAGFEVVGFGVEGFLVVVLLGLTVVVVDEVLVVVPGLDEMVVVFVGLPFNASVTPMLSVTGLFRYGGSPVMYMHLFPGDSVHCGNATASPGRSWTKV